MDKEEIYIQFIDGIKRNARVYVGDSKVRNTDARIGKDKDSVVCLPVGRIDHVAKRVEQIMEREN